MKVNFLRANVDLPSDRSFGFIFSLVFMLFTGYFFYSSGALNLFFLYTSFIFLVLAIFLPILLRPFNLIWFHFGVAVSRVTNPLILGLFFYVIFSSTAFFFRLFGIEMLDLKIDKNTNSYWIARSHPEKKDTSSFKNQF